MRALRAHETQTRVHTRIHTLASRDPHSCDTPVVAPAPAAAGKRKARVADDTPVDDNPENWSLDQLMKMSKGQNLQSWTKTRLAFEMNELEIACGETNTIEPAHVHDQDRTKPYIIGCPTRCALWEFSLTRKNASLPRTSTGRQSGG